MEVCISLCKHIAIIIIVEVITIKRALICEGVGGIGHRLKGGNMRRVGEKNGKEGSDVIIF